MLETLGTPQVEEYPYPLPKCTPTGPPEWKSWVEQNLIRHEHICDDCNEVFGCEGQHCESGNAQVCEECEIAAKRDEAATSRARLLDNLDDQAVIEEIKMRLG